MSGKLCLSFAAEAFTANKADNDGDILHSRGHKVWSGGKSAKMSHSDVESATIYTESLLTFYITEVRFTRDWRTAVVEYRLVPMCYFWFSKLRSSNDCMNVFRMPTMSEQDQIKWTCGVNLYITIQVIQWINV